MALQRLQALFEGPTTGARLEAPRPCLASATALLFDRYLVVFSQTKEEMGITRAAFYNFRLTLHHICVTPPSRAGNRYLLLKSSRRMQGVRLRVMAPHLGLSQPPTLILSLAIEVHHVRAR